MAEKRRNYTEEFKREAVRLVTEQGYGMAETARNLGINTNMLGRWKRECAIQASTAFPGGYWELRCYSCEKFFQPHVRFDMEPEDVKQLEAEIARTARMLLDSGDREYIKQLTLQELTQALVHEIRFLGLYPAADAEAEQIVHNYLHQHLWQLVMDTEWVKEWVKERWPLSLQAR